MILSIPYNQHNEMRIEVPVNSTTALLRNSVSLSMAVDTESMSRGVCRDGGKNQRRTNAWRLIARQNFTQISSDLQLGNKPASQRKGKGRGTAIGANKNPYPINLIILGKTNSTGRSALVHINPLPEGDSLPPGEGVFSFISIPSKTTMSFDFDAALALARIVSTVWARISEIEAKRDDTTQRVRTGRAP